MDQPRRCPINVPHVSDNVTQFVKNVTNCTSANFNSTYNKENQENEPVDCSISITRDKNCSSGIWIALNVFQMLIILALSSIIFFKPNLQSLYDLFAAAEKIIEVPEINNIEESAENYELPLSRKPLSLPEPEMYSENKVDSFIYMDVVAESTCDNSIPRSCFISMHRPTNLPITDNEHEGVEEIDYEDVETVRSNFIFSKNILDETK